MTLKDRLDKPRGTWPGWYGWAAMLASSLIFSLGTLALALHANAESDRKWCSIVTTLDSSYKESPPTLPTGIHVAQALEELRDTLDCPSG